jgi:electron transfer flavoprotein alpha subunit
MGLIIYQEKIDAQLRQSLIAACPFGALEEHGNKLEVNGGCKLCRLCVRLSNGGIAFTEEKQQIVNKQEWQGIAVYVEHRKAVIHPVVFELLAEARRLAERTGQQVIALLIGSDVGQLAKELLHYPVDEIFLYDDPRLQKFHIEPYTNVFSDFIQKQKPSAILVGATDVGRCLAPRVACRMHTGLTADCTALDIHSNSDLIQIRPAFGGNIMARILTPNSRPQFCTVRYKIFDRPERTAVSQGKVIPMKITADMLQGNIRTLEIEERPSDVDISEAGVIVACGRGLKSRKDLAMMEELANLLHGRIASSRPLVEANWFDAKQQIGLSGRTVKPKLIITAGISGSVQFVAGMKGADCIVAINNDPDAQIFSVAHYGLVGDLYEIIPALVKKIREEKNVQDTDR